MKSFSLRFLCMVCVVVIFLLFPLNTTAISTSAKAFCLVNAETGEVLAAENPHRRLSMASTTKIMTALILAEQNTPEKEVTVTSEMVTVEGSSMGLLAGDSVSYYELLVGMLLPSGNDAANTAAISVAGSVPQFVELMNKRAEEIGMKNTNFVTPSGLDSDEHYSTAYDMAMLTRVALKNDVINDIVSKESISVTFGNPPYQRRLYNHNKLLGNYEYCIGVKTGFTKKSGRCLVSAAETDSKTVIAVTLGDPNDWKDHKLLLDYGLSQLVIEDVTANMTIGTVPVVGGESDTISISTERYLATCTDVSKSNITSKVTVEPFVYAPVKAGQTVGRVDYYYKNELIHTTDIIALTSVDAEIVEKDFFEKLKDKLFCIIKCFI